MRSLTYDFHLNWGFTYSVMFSSILTSSSNFNCITKKGYLVCPCRSGGSKPRTIRVCISSFLGSKKNFFIEEY